MSTAVMFQYNMYRDTDLKIFEMNLKNLSQSDQKVPELSILLALPCKARRAEKSLFFSQSPKIYFFHPKCACPSVIFNKD